MTISLLNEFKDLPAKVTDPGWLEELEKDDELIWPVPEICWAVKTDAKIRVYPDCPTDSRVV